MPAKVQGSLDLEGIVTKFRERNQRAPRNPGELTQFSKQLRGVKPLSYADARKYFQQQQPKKKGKSASDDEKQIEEKQPEEETPEEPDEPSIYQVADQVTLTKDRSGIIRFVGPVEFAEGTWYGIELHELFVGKSDGSKDGKQYFECNPKRGIFVREDKIRRRMSRADHARKNTWMKANAERGSKLNLLTETSAQEHDDDEQERDVEQATEEKTDNDDADKEPTPPTEEDAPLLADEPNADDDDKTSEEVETTAPEEDLVVVNEPSENTTEVEIAVDEVEKRQNRRTSVRFCVEPTRRREIAEYFPAKEGQNLLQWLANQFDLSLRSDLFELYLNAATTARLRMVFDELKTFEDYEQQNLLLVDVLPRLCRDAI